jgi:hypothetical protein
VKSYQRQLILLIVVMALLTGIFLFMLQYSPSSVTPDYAENASETGKNSSNTAGNATLPGPIQQSVDGWEQLIEDLKEAPKLFFQSGNSS